MKLLYIVLFSLYLLLTFTPLFLAQQHQIDLTSDVHSVSFTSSEEIAQINSKSSTTTKKSNSASKSEKSSESKSSKKSDKSKKNATTSKTNQPQPPPLVNINPSYLDFDESPLCMPKVENVEIINKSPTEEVQLISLASDSDSFSSFVKSQIIPPKGSLNITVIFLPRRIGVLDNNLVIQTTVGGLLFMMTGTGIANAFRVAPIIGKKVSEGGVLMSHIDFYNPFSAPINVSDIFTHGGFLQLSNTENSDPISVMPYTETRIVSLMFSSNSTGKFVGSVNIRSSKGDIIVPMEVDVVKDVVYATPEVLDWGVLHNTSHSLSLPLSLLNSFNQPILVKHIQSSGDLPFTLPFTPIVIPPGVESTIANLSWIFAKEGKFEGKFTVLTNASKSHSSSIEVPYKANVVHGILKYSETNNSFSIKEINKGVISKAVIITNKFNSPMLIYSIDLVDSLFTIETYTPILFPLVVNPSSTVKLIAKYIGPLPLYSTYYCSILVSSNISIAEIPLSIFEGKLQVSIDEKTGLQIEAKGDSVYGLDLGAIATNDIQVRRVEITNTNPRSVPIYSMKSNMDQVVVKIEKILSKQNKVVNSTQPTKPKRKLSDNAETSILTVLESGHTLVMRIEIASPKEEQISGEIIVTTEYETMVFELKYQSVEGSLYMVPSSLKFPEKGFPGHSQKLPLQIKSTYSRTIQITTVTTQSPVFVPFLTELSVAPNELTDIGYLLFDPSQLPDEDNYMKTPSYLDSVSANGQILTKNDLAAFKYREFIWHSLLYSDATTIHSPLVINTNVNNPLEIPITGYLSKPSIFYEEELDFAIVQMDSYLDRVLLVQNPSDQYVYVELLPLMNNKIFTVLDDQLPKKILLPHSTDVLTTVRFIPIQQNIQYTANLYLKNNLTILDSIVLKGEGGAGILMLQSPDISPEEQAIMEDSKLLVFELTAQQLSNCKVNEFPGSGTPEMQQQQQQQPSTLHMVQSFLAINKGNLPISIQSMSINGKPCSGYGFEIEECSEFTLEPSEHRNVTIHYTPREFHSSLIKHQLIVDTNQGPQLFTLIINIPFEYLSLCSNLQPQIQFESFVYKILVTFVVVILSFLGFLTKRELVINLESCTIFENLHNQSSNIDSTSVSESNSNNTKSPIVSPQSKTPTPPSTPQVSPAPPQPSAPAALVKEPQGEKLNKSADSLGDKSNELPIKKRSGSESDKKTRNRKGSSLPSAHSSVAPVPPSTSTVTSAPAITTTATTKEKKKKDKQGNNNSSENTSGLRVINNPNAKFQIIEDFPSIVKRRPKPRPNKAPTEDNVTGTTAVDSLVDSSNSINNNNNNDVESTNTTLDDSGALDKSTESLSTSHENCLDISSDRDEPSKPNINNSSTPPLTPIRNSDNKLNRDIYRDYEILNSSDEEMFSLNNSFDSYDGIAPLNSILDTPVKPSTTTATTAVGVIGSGKAKTNTNPFGQYVAPSSNDSWMSAPPPAPLPFDPSIISYSTRNNYFSFGGGVPTSSLFSQPFLPPTTTAPSNTSYFSFAPPAPVNPNRERNSSYQLFDSTSTTSNDHMSPFQRFNPQ